MTLTRLMLQSLRRFWRTNLGVMLGIALASTVITGALLVGDSMRYTLAQAAKQRLGHIDQALLGGDRFFTASLADTLAPDSSGVIAVQGVAATPDGNRRANNIALTGIDDAFAKIMSLPIQPSPGQAVLNTHLAEQLGATIGDTLIVRVPKPSALPIDATLVNASEPALALRLRVAGVVDDTQGGRFSLRAEQRAPMNVFVDRGWLAEQLGRPGRINLALSPQAIERIEPGFDDLELTLTPRGGRTAELATPRVFLDASAERDLAELPGQRLLTYLVNTISHSDKQSPYAMVTAADQLGDLVLADDEIAINTWLADDLDAGIGDELTLTYYLPDEGDRLIEASATLTVARVVPIEGVFADRTLTPEFPGLAEADRLSRWDAGPAIDRGRIRDKDEAYWDTHRATPKAFINLKTGQSLWSNRFGTLTAIRFADDVNAAGLLEHIDPAAMGLVATDIRGQAESAAMGTVDFGQLFLSLSGFIIIAAVALAAMLFAMSIEQRARQLGTLLAVGLTRRQIAALLLGEGVVVASIGATLGLLGAIAYAYSVTQALTGMWSGAVAGTAVQLHITAASLIIGPVIAAVASLLAMAISVHGLTRRVARELLAGGVGKVSGPACFPRWVEGIAGFACFALAGYLSLVNTATGMRAALIGFAGGVACFVGCLLLLYMLLIGRDVRRRPGAALLRWHNSLAMLNLTRRRGRTIAGVFMLGAGLFLVYAVSGFHLGNGDDPADRTSGTGGFALIVESSQSIRYDLNTELGRDHYALSENELPPGSVVPIRVSGGDDASCLNLNQTPTPRVLGVDPNLLSERGAFSFLSGMGTLAGWHTLDRHPEKDLIPAIADANTAQWALKISVGDTVTITDEQGQPQTLQLVATIENSVLQGSLILNQRDFKTLFPSASGYAMMLIDASPPQQTDASAAILREVLVDEGVKITPTNERLADYNRVQNTYLAVFQLLGGLGVLLGALGLGVVTARNLLERRSELALLSAVGLSRGRIAWIVLTEHVTVLVLGLTLGSVSAWVATRHASESAQPLTWNAMLLYLAPLFAGLLAIAIGLLPALGGRLTGALRND